MKIKYIESTHKTTISECDYENGSYIPRIGEKISIQRGVSYVVTSIRYELEDEILYIYIGEDE